MRRRDVRDHFSSDWELENLADFKRLIGEYYVKRLATRTNAHDRLPKYAAEERAQAIVEADYRRRRMGISNACADAIQGTNGGMQRIFDLIRDALEHDAQGEA